MRQNWKNLIVVQAGGAICLPVFIIGHALAKNYGISSAILAIFLGNLLLACLGTIAASASATSGKSTAEYAVDIFGEKGKGLFAGAMVFSMVGWFAIQMNIMTSSLKGFLSADFTLILTLALGVLMTLVGIKGIKSLTALANLSMPFLLLTIGYALFQSKGDSVAELKEGFTFGGISLVLACGIAAVIDLPTFFRLAQTPKDAKIASLLLFGLVLPLVECVGLYLFMQAQGENIVEVLAQETSPLFWKLWVMLFILLAGWTTNNANLYSATVSLKTLVPKVSEKSRILILGAIGTALACMNLLDHLVFTLDMIGIVLGSMGAVIVFFLTFKQERTQLENIGAWIAGVTGGLLSYFGYGILQIPVLDAFSVAFTTKLLLKAIKYEKIINNRS